VTEQEKPLKKIIMNRLDIFEGHMNETAKGLGLNITLQRNEPKDKVPQQSCKKRGRKLKYETDEERREAKLRQTRESNKRMAEKRKEFEAQKLPAQILLSKQLSNIILTEKQTQELIEFFNWITEEQK
jgi:hypothetical protein